MKFLLDKRAIDCQPSELVAGQLLTPLTNYAVGEWKFAIDNGGYSRFSPAAFRSLVDRCETRMHDCLFVAMPDIVGSARRTLEVFEVWHAQFPSKTPLAIVAQDGAEDLPIPWASISAVFIGGTTDWKLSQCAADVVKAALALEKHVHVGRVNTVKRFRKFASLGCHTCDGSGVCRFSWMMAAIERGATDDTPLFEEQDEV